MQSCGSLLSSMKIQFALTEYLPDVFGGAEVYTRNLSAALVQRGHDVSILSPGIVRKNSEVNDELYEGIPVHRMAFVPAQIPPSLYAVRVYPDLYDEAVEWFNNTQPDVVHITNSWFMAPIVFAAAACGIPVIGTHVDFVWTCKESHLLDTGLNLCTAWSEQRCKKCFPDLTDDEWRWVHPLRDELHTLLAKTYAFHHCPCPLLADQIRRFGADEKAIGTWPYGIPDELAKLREKKEPSPVLRLAFIGRWNRIKGIDILLDAMEQLKNRTDIELHLYGEQEVWNADSFGIEVSEKADRLPQVIHHGRFDPRELGALHRDIDIIVTPSIWPENSPVSMLEALALGTPALCADGNGMTNLIEHNKNGLLFQSRSADSLAKQILRIANDRNLLRTLQTNAACLGRLSDDAKQFEKIYQTARPADGKPAIEFIQTIRSMIR